MGCGEIDGSYREQLFNPSMNTTYRMKGELNHTDVVFHIGDMSYAQGYAAIVSTSRIIPERKYSYCYCMRTNILILTQWDVFFDQLGEIAATKPYMVCVGNHERNEPDTM